jgi:hypothetical protein
MRKFHVNSFQYLLLGLLTVSLVSCNNFNKKSDTNISKEKSEDTSVTTSVIYQPGSAEEATYKNFKCYSEEPVKEFNVLGSRKLPEGIAIFYKAICPTNKDGKVSFEWVYGVAGVEQVKSKDSKQANSKQTESKNTDFKNTESKNAQWKVKTGFNRGEALAIKSDKSSEMSLESVVESSISFNKTYPVIAGKINSTKAAAVEASFNNGKTIRGDYKDGFFAVIGEAPGLPCEVRWLDANKQILSRYNLRSPKSNKGCPGA